MIRGAVMNFTLRLILLALTVAGPQLGAADDRRLPTLGMAIPIDAASDAPFQKAFRDGLRELGYVDGQNIELIVRYANGDPTKLREAIKELIALKVDILIGDAPVLREATSTIPIVSPTMGDPVKIGLVASLARPGGNVTGVSAQGYETPPKQLELAKELVPNLKKLYVLFEDDYEPGLTAYANEEFRTLAAKTGVSLRLLPVRNLGDIQEALTTIHADQPKALLVWATPLTIQYRDTILRAVAREVPVISETPQFSRAGAILTYSVDYAEMFRRSASYVDKILRGAKPGDLPIEQPTRFNLIVNLKIAKALGLKIPDSILVRADQVIR